MSSTRPPPISAPRSLQRRAVAMAAAAILISLSLGLLLGRSGSLSDFLPAARHPAPDAQFTDLRGQHISLRALRGKVVLVNFWATDCDVCIHEMPQMTATYNRFKNQGLEFIAVAMSYDRPDYVLDYAQTRQLPFAVALDLQDTLAQAFGGVKATPTTFLIGKDGAIVKRYVGEPDFDALHRLLAKELGA